MNMMKKFKRNDTVVYIPPYLDTTDIKHKLAEISKVIEVLSKEYLYIENIKNGTQRVIHINNIYYDNRGSK